MNKTMFKIPATKNSSEKQYKQLYVVETTRFEKCYIPRACSCYSDNLSLVAVAVDKKLNLVIFPTKRKEKPEVKKFNFEDPINSISICETENKYALLVATKNDAFVVDGNGVVTHIEIFPLTVAIIYSEENVLYFICGCDDGLVVKDSLTKSSKSQKMNPCCESGVSQLQISHSKSLIACGFLNGTVSLLKTSTLECIWTKTFSYGLIRAFAWNNASNVLAFAGQDDNFYEIDFNHEYDITCFEGHNSFVNSISLDPYSKDKEQRIFTSAEDAMIGAWTATNKGNRILPTKVAFVGPFEKPIRYIQAMKYFVVTIDTNGTIICWRKMKVPKE